ncbi:hypothetical protein KXQ82_14645 [Mucilaginibacter sp. HMF5004]|uniref:hypothetical protein n=1 Tax=Mucilaginibacter rivuli TaxID=2857527 RepID=UPI001C605975|nr:hypothetical protein [Mucilaginibacter rivuli]MBW4890963.1 hypothetical protein [Mucilaginibacter rivuli]
MSDKELDKLFNAQLADMELEPSAAVWNKIKLEVNGEDEIKKSYMPYLQIAAAVAVFITAALLLRPQTEKISLHGTFTASVTNESKTLVITPEPVVMDNTEVTDTAPQESRVNSRPVIIASIRHTEIHATHPVDTATQMVAAVNTQPDNITIPPQAVTTKPAMAPARFANVVADDRNRQARALTAVTPPAIKDGPAVKKKKIRSLGDLLNVVIAQVDKRPKKIVQFNDDEEDENFSPTRINLGLIQTRKDK